MIDNIFLLESGGEPSIINLTYTKTDLEEVRDWMEDNGILVITPTNTPDELEDLWSQWQQMSDTEQQSSDNKSMEVFGITNYDHYIGLLNKFYGNKIVEDDDYIQYITSEATYIYEDDSDKVKEIKTNIKNELCKDNKNNLYINSLFMSLNNLSRNLSSKVLEVINNESVNININSFPCFSVSEMYSFGVFGNEENNFYDVLADNRILGQDISTRKWFDEYKSYSEGFITENFKLYNKLWTDKLNELYSDFDKIKESGDINKINARKQSILELGWNPEIDFNIDNRIKATERMINLLESKYNKTKIYDLSNMCINENNIINESSDNNILYPVYIVLSYTFTTAGKIISKFTDSIYSHAALGLDPSLDKLYSFNMKNGNNGGFSIESIDNYLKKDERSKIAVYAVFVNKEDLQNIKLKLDYYLANIKNTSYSLSNIFNIAINKPIIRNDSDTMVCSQFVDFIFKSINVDITGKINSLVTPKDFFNIKNTKVYKVYEGLIKDYNKNKVSSIINRLQNKAKYIKENVEVINESQYINILNENYNDLDTLIYLNEKSDILSEQNKELFNNYIKPYIEVEAIYEAKEFPVQFDKEGNLLIKNMKKIDFEQEFAKSHKLLLLYEEKVNIEGIAYELCKLWFMNELLEQKIYNEKNSEEDLKKHHKARSKILNDYKKYLKFLLNHDKNFNFTEYYNNTPFSDANIKVSKHTLKYSGEALKNIVKLLL